MINSIKNYIKQLWQNLSQLGSDSEQIVINPNKEGLNIETSFKTILATASIAGLSLFLAKIVTAYWFKPSQQERPKPKATAKPASQENSDAKQPTPVLNIEIAQKQQVLSAANWSVGSEVKSPVTESKEILPSEESINQSPINFEEEGASPRSTISEQLPPLSPSLFRRNAPSTPSTPKYSFKGDDYIGTPDNQRDFAVSPPDDDRAISPNGNNKNAYRKL